MSTKTRHEKRKVAAEQPVETDWLWSCPPGMSQAEIAHRLGFTTEPRTDLSARSWTTEHRVKVDLYRAFAPHIPLSQLVPYMVWDAFDEHLSVACAGGYLIVLRDLPTPLPHSVQMLIDSIGFRRRERGVPTLESRPGARFALVLEGWPDATIRVRSRYTTRYSVQTLGDTSSASPPGQERPPV